METPNTYNANRRNKSASRQFISITGLGSPYFHKCMDGIQEIYNFFARRFPDKHLEMWQPDFVEGMMAIEVGNRYFTYVSDPKPTNAVPFSKLVDPEGLLTGLSGPNFVHTEDNVVEYYNMERNEEDNVLR